MTKFSIYLVSALFLMSCVSAGNFRHHHHHHHKNDQLDDLTTQILNFGINFIFERAADNYGVSPDNVEVTKINDIDRKNLDGPRTLYWFKVDATNNNDATVEARFGVEYNYETEEMTMGRGWRYHIHYYDNVNNEEGEFEGFLNEEDNNLENAIDEGEIDTGIEIIVEAETEIGVDEEGTDDNNEDFEQVPQAEIENDSVIQDVLQDGAAFIFNRAADRFGVSNNADDIEITNVDSVERRNGDNTTTYRINIDATNNDDARVNARLTIDHDNETGENTVGPWRYSINYRIFNNEEGGSLEEESIFEFDMNDDTSN